AADRLRLLEPVDVLKSSKPSCLNDIVHVRAAHPEAAGGGAHARREASDELVPGTALAGRGAAYEPRDRGEIITRLEALVACRQGHGAHREPVTRGGRRPCS